VITVRPRARAFLTRLTLSCAAAIALAGCGGGDDLGPPEIHFGQDTCHACGMIIEDDRYAAAVVSLNASGDLERHAFDDAGEMLEAAQPAGAKTVRRYVRDASTRQWVDADKATFAKTRDLHTPMGSGIAAYADPAAARAAVEAHGGSVLAPGAARAAVAP
jgi:copper chaperone NosL